MDKVCMYLRKSRADEECENRGEDETLSKHRSMLIKVANEQNLKIVKIHEEIVSGESLVHRPEMLELLKEVEKCLYSAVLCMDVDRLGRGNMQEQGLILETFKKSNTKIITPRKIYDLHDEFDEEYSEFEAFMARKELKIINRRLQRGRIRSVEEGNYIGTLPPYGYEIHYENGCRTLNPNLKQAPIVKMIFDLYINYGLGASKIANKLNQLDYKTYTGKHWTNNSVLNIIKNEVYTGKIQWGKKRYNKSNKPNQEKEVKSLPRQNWISVPGKHEPLVSKEIYEKAMEILNKRSHVPYNTKIINPLAGIIKCQLCGSSMVYRSYTSNKDPHIICYNSNCTNKSSKFKYVEKRLLDGLEQWLEGYELKWDPKAKNNNKNIASEYLKLNKKSLKNLENNLENFINQKNKLHDLLERNIYDVDIYLKRSQVIMKKIENIKIEIQNTKKEICIEEKRIKVKDGTIPNIRKVISLYYQTKDAKRKNELLKNILDYVIYYKDKSQQNDEFTLILYTKLPK